MKYLKHLAALFLQGEIKQQNAKLKSMSNWIIKLENAIVDENKGILLQAMYRVAERRNQELKLKWDHDRQKKIPNISFNAYTTPVEVILADKK